MLFSHWLAFALASTVLVMMPGPTVLLVVSYALGHGRKSALATAVGVGLGDLTTMTASMIGLGALLTASASVFTVLRLIGAAYLVYLGVKLWRAPVTDPGAVEAPDVRPGRVIAHAYAVTALNPKSIIFFIAFVPQFLDPGRLLASQAAILIATFVVLAVG